MKHVNIAFEDREYKELSRIKKGKTWHDLFLEAVRLMKEEKKQ